MSDTARSEGLLWEPAVCCAAIHSTQAVTILSDERLNMAEQENNKPTPKTPEKKDISMEQRLLIAFALMGIVLFASQFLYKAPNPKDTIKPVQSATPEQAKKPEVPASAPGIQRSTTPSGAVAAQKSESYVIDTNVFKIVLNNHGAVIRSWQLKQYRDGTGRPLELVNASAASKTTLSVIAAVSNLSIRRPT